MGKGFQLIRSLLKVARLPGKSTGRCWVYRMIFNKSYKHISKSASENYGATLEDCVVLDSEVDLPRIDVSLYRCIII